jgi:hypothetical protein
MIGTDLRAIILWAGLSPSALARLEPITRPVHYTAVYFVVQGTVRGSGRFVSSSSQHLAFSTLQS